MGETRRDQPFGDGLLHRYAGRGGARADVSGRVTCSPDASEAWTYDSWLGSFSVRRWRISGHSHATRATTNRVPMPPATTETTGPNNCASAPDSKPPSWFEAPMNSELTAPTRPRISSGVRSNTRVLRITTLMLSNAPSRKSIMKESANEWDRPKTTVTAPKAARSEEH